MLEKFLRGGGKCPGGICPRGVIVRGYLSGGNCPGGNCPDTAQDRACLLLRAPDAITG